MDGRYSRYITKPSLCYTTKLRHRVEISTLLQFSERCVEGQIIVTPSDNPTLQWNNGMKLNGLAF